MQDVMLHHCGLNKEVKICKKVQTWEVRMHLCSVASVVANFLRPHGL